MPEEKKGEQQGYVYDYASGQFILTTLEEVKAREAYYAKYPAAGIPTAATRVLFPKTGIVGNILPPTTPLSFPVLQYLKDAASLIDHWRELGYLTPQQAQSYYDAVRADIAQGGLTQRTYLSNEVAQWRERQTQTRATPENRMERTRESIAERIAEEKANEAEIQPAMTDITNRAYAILGNTTMSFQQKGAALRELSTGLLSQGMTQYEATQWFNRMQDVAGAQLSETERGQAQGVPIQVAEMRGIKSPEELALEEEQRKKWDELKKFASMGRQRVTSL